MQRTYSPSDLTARLRPLRVGDSWDPWIWSVVRASEPEARVARRGRFRCVVGSWMFWPPGGESWQGWPGEELPRRILSLR